MTLGTRNSTSLVRWTLGLLAGTGLLSAVGCQVDVGGQTLPSPWYHKDDVQYYAPGPEFKLSREAAAMRQFQDSQDQQDRDQIQ